MNNNNTFLIVVGIIGLIVFIKVYQTADAIGSDIANPLTNTFQGLFNWFD